MASNATSQMEIAVAILMPSPVKPHKPLNRERRMTSFSSGGSVKKRIPEEWEEQDDHPEELDYSIGLVELSCYHRKPLEFG